MPYICQNCDHFEAEVATPRVCPQCGGRMRMTMLAAAPGASLAAAVGKPSWKDPYVNGYEVMEAPWKCRYAQLVAGISTYWFVYRWGPRLLAFMAATPVNKMSKDQLAALAIAVVIVHCLGAFAGGIAAGFWARAWVLQGLGVMAGVLAIPLVGLFFAYPKDWSLFAIALVASSMLAVAGAMVGHTIVKPTRIPTS